MMVQANYQQNSESSIWENATIALAETPVSRTKIDSAIVDEELPKLRDNEDCKSCSSYNDKRNCKRPMDASEGELE
jgi:hypothetical protein